MIQEEKFKIQPEEQEDDYKFRICSLREENKWTWQEVADLINSQLDEDYSESKYRKDWKNYCAGYKAREKEESIDPEIDKLIEAKISLEKEKVKLSDEKIQVGAYIRQLAREETLKEIGTEVAKFLAERKPLYVEKCPDNIKDSSYYYFNSSKKAAIVCISDWHYGLVCDNFWNKYDPEVANDRIQKLLTEVIIECRRNNCETIYVVNLGDLICGRIHYTLRLQSRFDVITQTLHVSEMVSEFIGSLKFAGFKVEYYDCTDNHSRLEPDKHKAMDLESLSRIIPWYLKTRFEGCPDVCIHDNKFGEDIFNFKVFGVNIIGTHGDKDAPKDVVEHLTLMTKDHYDLVLTAHLHHFSADEQNQTVVISNGSLMGTDTYAKNLRLSSDPSQNLIFIKENGTIDSIKRIVLK